jgi:exodeoxyribonuclease VII small subunit
MNIIKMNKKNDELNFEDSLMRLEQIAELLENENTPLEESISLFEEGIALKEICDLKLKKAKLKIEKIIKSKNTITTEDFE